MVKNRALRVFAGVVVAILVLAVGSASAAAITVDDSGGADYLSIQAAINNASVGDVIEVQSGTYYENVVVNKTLSLVGIGMPLINASGSGTAMTITTDDCTIDGFNVTGSGTDWNGGDADSGIKIMSDDNTVLNCIAQSNNYGVYVFESENNTIENNSVYSNTEGIYLLYSHNNSLISNNLSSNTNRGAYISNSDNISVLSNVAQNNDYGINWYISGNSTVFNNSATSNNYGMYLSSSENCNLDNNTAYGNTNHGIYSDSSGNIFTNNTAYSNIYGLYTTGSSSTLANNIAYSNKYGFYTTGSSSTLTNNIAYSNRYGFYTTGSSSTLTNNTAYSNTNRGFTIHTRSTLIDNNAFNNGYGFWIESDYNILTNNTASDNANYGFYIYIGDYNKLTKNTANSNSNYGYYIIGNYNTLTKNNVSDNSGGIHLTSGGASRGSNLLIQNTIINNSNYGIYLSYSGINILMYNVVSNNTNTGIYISDSKYNTLTNNVVSNNTNNGIYLTSSSDSTLTNNIVSNNTNHGIYLSNSIDTKLLYNLIFNNTNTGVYLFNSGGGALANNTIDNSNDGIYIDQGTTSQSSIYNNTLLNISNHGAYDIKGLNSWHSNYYDDYNGIDSNNDGIGDSAYYIAGNDVGLRDETPLMQPHQIIIPDNDYNNENTYLGASFTVKAGTAILLYEGYSLVPLQFDVSGEKVWFELRMNGNRIDDEVLEIGSYFSYVGSQNQLILTGRLDSISQADNSMKMDSFYQFSQPLTNREILIGDTSDIPYPNPTITLPNPSSSLVSDIEGDSRLFTMNVNQVSDVTWILDGITLYTNTSVTTASYYNGSAQLGTHNLTVVAENTNRKTSQKNWTWTVTEPSAPSITLSSPSSASISDIEGDSRTFTTTVDQVVNVTWILDGNTIQTNTSIQTASYYNGSAKVGIHNLTIFAENVNGTDQNKWTWTVTEPPAPSITHSSPSSVSISDVEGDSRTFTTTVDQVANVTWILDGNTIQTNTSIQTASYYNNSAKTGTHNLTVFAENTNGTDQKKWTWIVAAPPAPSITLSLPSLVSDVEGDSRSFTATIDQVANVTWIFDGIILYTNTSVTTAAYYNTSAHEGVYNITIVAENANGASQNKWTWTVTDPNLYTMQLQKGWNLVSTPLTPDTPSVNTLFGSNSDVILPVYSWNTANKQYYDVSTIEISKGYWILALNDTQVTFAGTSYSE
ncbi:NosD domain-containing protein [Methanococcoides burtonii]|uniref:Cell surface glycoprotein with copper-binding domain n=1 Tax=Methanococcoides burtonii (strain DSM 6242 / NBRC 107633 / OCM 468 / ACE-M) TaxID=259564 RepID=Q12VI3_METBU|nr:NosD domain-containing protein [Methanococcoides burtonii]ABE52543.1 Cell surface glycoprotein with copper-binding domain [Methanococcoides burtonii DSM 6242]